MTDISPLPQRTAGRLSRRRHRNQLEKPTNTLKNISNSKATKEEIIPKSQPTSSAKMADSELDERRQAEMEFVSCAYNPEEAWCDTNSIPPRVVRRITLHNHNSTESVTLLLNLSMIDQYPAESHLEVSFTLEKGPTYLWNLAFDAAPLLAESCRQVARSMVGEEAVFAVLNQADEWVQEEWSPFIANHKPAASTQSTNGTNTASTKQSMGILGRRLIYSHHIISKIKRGDMKQLASHYQLTGYVKIGWPGIIIIEGLDEHCEDFYNDIKVWNWKFLVMRGRQQEKIATGETIDSKRKFSGFVETSEMSLVANHCRQVGLESLFRTSMKVYDNTTNNDGDDDENESEGITPYGALVWVDHMNDAKGYRKWLRKTSSDTNTFLLIKQSFPNHDFTKKPTILVAFVGDADAVQDFMKRWRTSRVDVDSKGKACLERKMKVLHEGSMDNQVIDALDWETASADASVNVDRQQLLDTIRAFGNAEWLAATESLLSL